MAYSGSLGGRSLKSIATLLFASILTTVSLNRVMKISLPLKAWLILLMFWFACLQQSLLSAELRVDESAVTQTNIPSDCGSVPRLFALKTSVNQLALGRSKATTGENLPPAVARKVRELGLQLWQYFRHVVAERHRESGTPEAECYPKVADIFGNAYRLQYKGTIEVFVAHFYGGFGYEEVRIILFDKVTERVTATPPEVFSRWRIMAKDDSLRGTILRFEDIDRDGRNEIGVLEYIHNGNMYNGQVIHYFTVDEGLGLNESLNLEIETLTPHIRIKRSIQWISANSLNLIVSTYNEYDGTGKLIDKKSYLLSRRSRGEPYRLIGKFPKQNAPWIVSGCGDISANDFLAHGCSLRY